MTEGDRSPGVEPRICDICFEEIPPGEPVVRAARQLNVSPHHPRAGRLDGSVICCDERCWATLRLSGAFRRIDET